MRVHRIFWVATAIILSAGAAAQDRKAPAAGPAAPANPERQAFYGDLHLHTTYSLDAYLYSMSQVDPDGAYRFARGQPGKYLDEPVKRSSPPLDFAAVTDHAEWLGILSSIEDSASPLATVEPGKPLEERKAVIGAKLLGGEPLPGVDARAMTQSAWQRIIAAANRNYQPGKFTTFIAYEWSASPEGVTLHRNVIFRGNKAPNPFTSKDSSKPEDLWAFLEEARRQGHEALAIPHNSNMSNGLAFDWVASDGKPIDQSYAQRRAANEPLVEIVQNKGQSEIHPAFSIDDELADFEILKSFLGKGVHAKGGSNVRDALGRGLVIAGKAGGINPYKYGFVGASDFHNGLSDAAENAYAGTYGAIDPTQKMPDMDQCIERMGYEDPAKRERLVSDLYFTGSAGLTGVWAERNTREAIYAALRRRETFATSGPRLKLRLFAGWNFPDEALQDKAWVKLGYRTGVPMGSDLPPNAPPRPPRFLMWAAKDPNGANLDRLQIIKVWLQRGAHADRIYNVVLSGGRVADPKAEKAPPVGDTVDVKTATYTNTIGAAELSALWEDPSFDPNVPAAYFLRVIEIPTPRWSTIAAVKRQQAPPKDVPATIQERGWSSPVWYSAPEPAKKTEP